jgi:hypothetical protein
MTKKFATLPGVESLKIILLATAAAIAYGVALDQIAIRVCQEYFTVAHAPIFRTDLPTMIAFGRGVATTWWAGLAAGIGFALAARAGPPEKFTWRRFTRSVLVLLLVMGATAAIAGFVGHWMATAGRIPSMQVWGLMLPEDKQPAFMADVFAHAFGYLAGGAGSVIIALATAWERLT